MPYPLNFCQSAIRFRWIPAFAVLLMPVVAWSQASQSVNRPPTISEAGGAIPVKEIEGRLVVSCDISGSKLRVPVNLWLDFDGAYGLQLHDRAAAPLPAETQSGQPLPLTLHFPDFTMEVARRELGPEASFEAFTKYHSEALGENALVGAIGAKVLKHFDVVFELPRGQVLLLPPGQLAQQEVDPLSDDVVVPISLHSDRVWLPVTFQDSDEQQERAMAIGSSRYDSLLDRRLCHSLNHPAGDVGPVTCETMNFASYVAFRPEEIRLEHPEGAAAVMGINLLKHFRIHIDRESLLASLRSTGTPDFPHEELAWFQAMVAEDRDLVLRWLEQYGETRLGREAAEYLLNLALEESAPPEHVKVAIGWMNDTMPEDLRATRMFDLMEQLVALEKTELGIVAGQLGVKSARKDRYPDANYKLHGRLGELLLPTDRREAWRHLLSAAFGMPEDGMINLNLARVYEANGKRNRAFSRYIQALVKEESSELAMEALMRLDQELPPEERMTIESIDRMISGRVRNFSAPDVYEFEEAERTNRTCVVEFFTNAYVGTEQQGGAIGGAMGNQGVLSHFKDSECVCLSYHLTAPRLEPLVTPLGQFMAQWLGVNGPVVQVIDGIRGAPGVGKHRDAEKIYHLTRDAVIGRLGWSSPIEVAAKASLQDGLLQGEVTIEGPPIDSAKDLELDPLVIQVVVAERGVVFHGSSGVVIHRMLARGLATRGPLSGVPYLPDDEGRLKFSIQRELAEIERENASYLDSLEAGQSKGGTRMGMRIEPSSVEVIVLVRDARSGEVIQAHKCELQREEAQP